MVSHASQSFDRFATTRWSMVLQLGDHDVAEARGALGDLVQRYWYPVYAYVRCRGQPARAAEEITRGVLQQLIDDGGRAAAASTPRQYRSFLLERVRAIADALPTTAAADGSTLVAPPDLEQRFQTDHRAGATAEDTFQRSYALVVLRRALTRLRSEAAQGGRADMCRALEAFLSRDPTATDYERIAAQLQVRKITLILALKRLRQRLRELAAQELGDTVSSADDLGAEQEALLAVLGDQVP
jgi:RNA polymerase sigma-70 factor (ECF subfamily)